MRMLPLAGILVGVVLLSGCVPGDPVVTPQPEPSSTPLFASEEEALAAATEAYAAYLAMSDTITSEGGANPERIKPFVSEEQYEYDVEVFEAYGDRGLHSEGQSAFDSARIQSFDSDLGEVTIYLCSVFSSTRVLNSLGEVVTPTDLPERSPTEVALVLNAEGVLVVERGEPWPGEDFCV
ncbi:hypothetical protein BH09ACT3_BH09ACT3_09200 [soil metagenome]